MSYTTVFQCQACNHEANNDIKHCSECGSAQFQRRQVRNKPQKRKPLLLILPLVVVVGGILLLYVNPLNLDLSAIGFMASAEDRAKTTIGNMYQVVHLGSVEEFDDVFADRLDQWFSYSDITLEEVKNKTETYRNKFPFQESDIDWESLTLFPTSSGGQEAFYRINYRCRAATYDPWMSFTIDINLELNDDFKVSSLTEDIIETTRTVWFDANGKKVDSRNAANYFGEFTTDGNNVPLESSSMYYLNNQLKFQGTITKFDNNFNPTAFEGTVEWFHSNGRLALQAEYDSDHSVKHYYPLSLVEWDEDGRATKNAVFDRQGRTLASTTNEYAYDGGLVRQVQLERMGATYTEKVIDCSFGTCWSVHSDALLDTEDAAARSIEWIGEESWTRTNRGLTNTTPSGQDYRATDITTDLDLGTADFSIHVDAVNPEARKSLMGGILFGYRDRDNNISFVFDHDGFTVLIFRGGRASEIIPYTMSSAIKKASWNRIGLSRKDGLFIAEINGEQVASFNTPPFPGSRIGLSAPPEREGLYGFKKFEIKTLEDAVSF